MQNLWFDDPKGGSGALVAQRHMGGLYVPSITMAGLSQTRPEQVGGTLQRLPMARAHGAPRSAVLSAQPAGVHSLPGSHGAGVFLQSSPRVRRARQTSSKQLVPAGHPPAHHPQSAPTASAG